MLRDAQNFSYSAELDVEVVTAQELTNVTIAWTGITTDIRGRPLDPYTDVGDALVLVFPNLSRQEILDEVSNDTLNQSAIGAYFTCETSEGSCKLDDFCIFGSCPGLSDNFTAAEGNWMVVLRSAEEQGALAMVFVEPTSTGEAVISFADGSSEMTLSADVTSPNAVSLTDSTELSFDWSELTTDGLGNDLALHQIDQLQVAWYDMTISELESQFLLMDDLPERTWTVQTESASRVSMDEASGDTDFDGVSADGTWIVALRCTTCFNPVPKFIGQLELEQ